MQIALYPVLLRPSRLHHFKVAVLFGKCLEMAGEVRSLREIGVEVTAYYPVVLLLCGITMEHLNLHS